MYEYTENIDCLNLITEHNFDYIVGYKIKKNRLQVALYIPKNEDLHDPSVSVKNMLDQPLIMKLNYKNV